MAVPAIKSIAEQLKITARITVDISFTGIYDEDQICLLKSEEILKQEILEQEKITPKISGTELKKFLNEADSVEIIDMQDRHGAEIRFL